MRIAELLGRARERGVDRLDAQLLLARRLGRSRAWLIAHDDDLLDPALAAACLDDIERRADGVPLAYLVGEREFHGLSLQVTPDVLVPRPDTEVIVDWALELLPEQAPARVADLGTGSGAIALAVKHRRPGASVVACDLSPAALAVASGNAARLGLAVEFVQGSWWAPLHGRRFDLVLSNPPYIAGDDPHLPALRHEPTLALTPGGDGLDALRRIVDGARAHLAPGGWLLLEHGHDQGAPVRRLLADAGFEDVQTRRDIEGRERCTGGRAPG